MLYQKIFTDEKPYHVGLGRLSKFPEHRHADFEFNFCVSGGFEIEIDKKKFTVRDGEMSLIPPMCSHAIPGEERERSVLTLIVGMTLLKKHFKDFSRLSLEPCVFDLNSDNGKRIRELFYECAEIGRTADASGELLLTGNVYKIMAYLLRMLESSSAPANDFTDYRQIENVERALELIHYNYKEPITVDSVSELTGYSKSNFCKIFKKVVGEGFHKALNRQRVECAAGLLTVSNMSVSDISSEVGFLETKTFCRVFKSIMGVTPGQYRSAKKEEQK